jgi:hypothetical protein
MSSQQAQSKREMPIAEVVRLIDLVNYQEGAVVSRTRRNSRGREDSRRCSLKRSESAITAHI